VVSFRIAKHLLSGSPYDTVMTEHKTLDNRYKGHWENVDDDCMLCQMEKRTHWYLETREWVIAEKLSGGPFVVYKRHTENLSDEQWSDMERVVGKVFDEFEVEVRMNLCPHHWHGHLIGATGSPIDLSNE